MDSTNAEPSTSASTIPLAPELPLPNEQFYSVEYPGYVQPSSIPLAITSLGGQKALDAAFKGAKSKADALVECTLRPENPYSHPIPGETVQTNKILLKIVKKKRKSKDNPDDYVGEFTAEAVGTVPKTARFRSILDFQFLPDPEDPISKLRTAMDNLDADALYDYQLPPERAEYRIPASEAGSSIRNADGDVDMNLDPSLRPSNQGTQPESSTPEGTPMVSNLRPFPPPLFSRSTVFQHYNFRSNPTSMLTTAIDEQTGEEKKRLINRFRFKGYAPVAIHYSELNIPSGPLPQVEEMRQQVNQDLLSRLRKLFEERPVWTRNAILSRFTALETREIVNSKVLLPLVAYNFHDGPWRDTLVRFDYDPREDPEARFYQRLYFRNINNVLSKPSVGTRRQDRAQDRVPVKGRFKPWEEDPERDAERRKSHIFDGKVLYKDTAAFQLCDIIDPFLRAMIHQEDLRDAPDERDGWYQEELLDQIRGCLRLKYFSLLEGKIVSDEECREMMLRSAEAERSMSQLAREKTGSQGRKRAKAKGAARPEDAAAQRLRAAMNSAMDEDY